jgi:hypothetical protein
LVIQQGADPPVPVAVCPRGHERAERGIEEIEEVGAPVEEDAAVHPPWADR